MGHEEKMYRLCALLVSHVDHILVSKPVTFLAMVFCIHPYIHEALVEKTPDPSAWPAVLSLTRAELTQYIQQRRHS
jgi:hypothetical protein